MPLSAMVKKFHFNKPELAPAVERCPEERRLMALRLGQGGLHTLE